MCALCSWCGSPLKNRSAAFCAECKAPQTALAYLLYVVNFIGTTLAIPLAIAAVTFILTSGQQRASETVASRQKLAEALGEVGKVQADYHLATTQITFMAFAKEDTISAKEFKDALTRIDLSISSFGAKLGPFEEFARRTNYYGEIPPGEPSPLQRVWDECFVKRYWPGYLTSIKHILSTCDEVKGCPRSAAEEVVKIFDEFYKGLCFEHKPADAIPLKWFNRELKRISIQAYVDPKDRYKEGYE